MKIFSNYLREHLPSTSKRNSETEEDELFPWVEKNHIVKAVLHIMF